MMIDDGDDDGDDDDDDDYDGGSIGCSSLMHREWFL
jgi:hypothetical protein